VPALLHCRATVWTKEGVLVRNLATDLNAACPIGGSIRWPGTRGAKPDAVKWKMEPRKCGDARTHSRPAGTSVPEKTPTRYSTAAGTKQVELLDNPMSVQMRVVEAVDLEREPCACGQRPRSVLKADAAGDVRLKGRTKVDFDGMIASIPRSVPRADKCQIDGLDA